MSMAEKEVFCRPEIWGGIECTISRTNDTYSDQLLSTGHYSRASDIERLAELGIKALRYPVLWEHHQPHQLSCIDWSWADRQLTAIRRHNITPILGLLHHGSGPSFTQLDCPHFADHFAAYAGQVAAKFPWAEYYTPVNEPLTTSRFSGLYGLWYPHKKDPLSFVNMLLNQLKGIVYAMKAIRRINPAAKLIQTEDLAKVHSTSALAGQANFENERRWLTYDLLCGKMDKTHPLWDYLIFIGLKESQLAFFSDNPCIPDIIGVNYYVTSERYLDEDLHKFPSSSHGGNGAMTYADVAAVRVVERDGLSLLLRELYDRYKLPIAITEAHLNCSREEQLRWLNEIWQISCKENLKGIDIRGITPWALLGAYDWDSLLTRNDLHYESGAYAIKEGVLQLTAVGHMIRTLARHGRIEHPLLNQSGWWGRNEQAGSQHGQLLIFGGAGNRNRLLEDILLRRGISFKWMTFSEKIPVLQERATRLLLKSTWGVIEISGNNPEAGHLAAFCSHLDIPYLNYTSALTGDPQPECVKIDEVLDLFIDKAIAMTSISHNHHLILTPCQKINSCSLPGLKTVTPL